jgi:hypothetical protein
MSWDVSFVRVVDCPIQLSKLSKKSHAKPADYSCHLGPHRLLSLRLGRHPDGLVGTHGCRREKTRRDADEEAPEAGTVYCVSRILCKQWAVQGQESNVMKPA